MQKKVVEILPMQAMKLPVLPIPPPPLPPATPQDQMILMSSVVMLTVLAIGVCAFFANNTFQPKNEKLFNKKQDQPLKRRHMLLQKLYNN